MRNFVVVFFSNVIQILNQIKLNMNQEILKTGSINAGSQDHNEFSQLDFVVVAQIALINVHCIWPKVITKLPYIKHKENIG